MTGAEAEPVASLALHGAEHVLRPPEDGLPFLRHDRAGDLRTDGGALSTRGADVASFDDDPGAELRFDARGCTLIPGFVDCHTHVPFAGWRADEYALKLAGVPYPEIARRGGGIASSARAFAAASDDEVVAAGVRLAGEMLRSGTTTFESKCGYGLTIDAERRALRLGGELGVRVPQATTRTALLAHAVPAGTTREAWMDEVAAAVPGIVADGLASALDIYVETVAFTTDDLARMCELATATGVLARCHAEQFSTQRSVPVALEHGARSVDHLACLHPDDVEPLARSACAAVFLPGAEFLGDEELAPARAVADAGAICVLATDCNPGTSPVASIPVVIGLAVRRYRWSAAEAVLAATHNAAYVLGLSGERGSLEVGKRADVAVLDGPIEHLPYRFGRDPVVATIVDGQLAHVRPGEEWRVRR